MDKAAARKIYTEVKSAKLQDVRITNSGPIDAATMEYQDDTAYQVEIWLANSSTGNKTMHAITDCAANVAAEIKTAKAIAASRDRETISQREAVRKSGI